MSKFLSAFCRPTCINRLSTRPTQQTTGSAGTVPYVHRRLMLRFLCAIFSAGNFSLFAVFVISKWLISRRVLKLLGALLQGVTERLVSGIPDKIKLIFGPCVPKPAPETLVITTRFTVEAFLTFVLDILNNRWQTLDLVSMMEELNRSCHEKIVRDDELRRRKHLFTVRIADRLSSLPRFKKEEDLTD